MERNSQKLSFKWNKISSCVQKKLKPLKGVKFVQNPRNCEKKEQTPWNSVKLEQKLVKLIKNILKMCEIK